MTELILLQSVRDLNKRIDEEIQFYEDQLRRCETRLSLLNRERQQLLELLTVLENEKNKA